MTRKKKDVTYDCLYMENEYVKLCVLPEIGGRLLYAVDKTNGYDIFYRNSVVKPANVGMTGAWISGGVEWNVFHHHRQTSHIPCDWRIVDNRDGSVGDRNHAPSGEILYGDQWTFDQFHSE